MKNKDKFRIYLANFTHNYIALANANFPLGISYIASALKHYLGEEIEVELFKFPEDLEQAINAVPPDAYLFTTYVWTHNLPIAFAKKIKEKYHGTLVVGGGPNFSKDLGQQNKFLQANPWIDFFVPYEGEAPICHLMKNYLDLGRDISKLKEIDLPSTVTILKDGSMKTGTLAPRTGMKKKKDQIHFEKYEAFNLFSKLDEVPSPYLTGLMDKFFNNQLQPLIATNRGCPFSCTFCHEGTNYFSKIAFQSLERLKLELEYIAQHMTKLSPDVYHLEIADSNFAMYPQDLKICEYIRSLQDKYQWPRTIGCSTGKNQPERILNAVSMLKPDTLSVSNSMQSTFKDTLDAIKRSNINLDGYKKVQNAIYNRGLRSMADVILGLPLETKDSHFKAVYELVDSGVQEFTSYQSMNLKSTELEMDSIAKKYGFCKKWRLIPRAIGEYTIVGNKTIVAEAEEITVATNTLSFDEYLASRRLHLVTMIFNNSKVFDLVLKYIKKKNIAPSQFIKKIIEDTEKREFPLKTVFREFINETKMELFETEEECLHFYTLPENLLKVKNADLGDNLLFKYLSISLFEYWNSVVEVMLIALGKLVLLDEQTVNDLQQIFRARIIDIQENRIQKKVSIKATSPQIISLLQNKENQLEKDFKESFSISMELSDSKLQVINGAKMVHADSRIGRSLILRDIRVANITREITANA